jgi:hypothetical protein
LRSPADRDERGASLVVSPDSRLKELVLYSRKDEEERARDAVIDTYQRCGGRRPSTPAPRGRPRAVM